MRLFSKFISIAVVSALLCAGMGALAPTVLALDTLDEATILYGAGDEPTDIINDIAWDPSGNFAIAVGPGGAVWKFAAKG